MDKDCELPKSYRKKDTRIDMRIYMWIYMCLLVMEDGTPWWGLQTS